VHATYPMTTRTLVTVRDNTLKANRGNLLINLECIFLEFMLIVDAGVVLTGEKGTPAVEGFLCCNDAAAKGTPTEARREKSAEDALLKAEANSLADITRNSFAGVLRRGSSRCCGVGVVVEMYGCVWV
jgi:hypothetical protein